jgi:subtilase family serine protease
MTRDLSFTYTSLTSLSNKYITAVVDSDNKVAETNENNNVAVASIP